MKIAKAFWLISLFLFLGLLLFNHANAPELMVLPFSESFFSHAITKNHFFYGSLSIFMLSNLLFMITGRVYPLASDKLPIPQKAIWLTNTQTRRLLFEMLNDWTKGLAFLFNALIMTIMGIIIDFNDVYMHYQLHLVIVLELILLLAWLGAFYFIFNKTENVRELLAVQ